MPRQAASRISPSRSFRQADESDLIVDRMGSGDIFGEYSLLTGQATSATVRALDQVVVHTIPKSALQPIIEARPELVVELSVLLADRRGNRRFRSEDYLFGSSEPPNAGTVARPDHPHAGLPAHLTPYGHARSVRRASAGSAAKCGCRTG